MEMATITPSAIEQWRIRLGFGESSEFIGSWIRSMRTHLGMSQADLAKFLGTGQVSVSQWERGKFSPDGRHAPTLLALEVMACLSPGYSIVSDSLLGRVLYSGLFSNEEVAEYLTTMGKAAHKENEVTLAR